MNFSFVLFVDDFVQYFQIKCFQIDQKGGVFVYCQIILKLAKKSDFLFLPNHFKTEQEIKFVLF